MIMDLDAKKGTRVRYINPESGYPHDIKRAKEHLTLGKIYTVERTVINDWSTDVWLDGYDVPFNHAHFDEVDADAIDEIVAAKRKPMPEKLQAIICDSDYAFVVRIGTDPRTTGTGILNVICQGLDREDKDYVIDIANHIVELWNSQEISNA